MSFRKTSILYDVLRELRIHVSPRDSSSEGIRHFIRKHYISLKEQHSNLPILIRECDTIEPKIYARYDYGKEVKVDLSHLSPEDIQKTISNLMTHHSTTTGTIPSGDSGPS